MQSPGFARGPFLGLGMDDECVAEKSRRAVFA